VYLLQRIRISFRERGETKMPIYEYKCTECEPQFEEIRPLGDDGKTLICPDCGTKAPKKVPSVFAAGSDQSSSAPCGDPSGCSTPFG